MARLPTLPGLTLLLPLFFPPWAPTRVRARKVDALTPTEMYGSLGSAVTLLCHLQPLESQTQQVIQIRWKRLDPLRGPSIVAEFHWERGPSIPEPHRVKFVADRLGADLLGTSLTIRELSPGNEANYYTCEIHISTSQIASARTWLHVFYASQVSITFYETSGSRATGRPA